MITLKTGNKVKRSTFQKYISVTFSLKHRTIQFFFFFQIFIFNKKTHQSCQFFTNCEKLKLIV